MQLVTQAQSASAPRAGFTLIELLVVLVIIGILLAIAVPSYLASSSAPRTGGRLQRAARKLMVEAFYADNNTYVGMSIAALKSIDQAVNLSAAPPNLSASTYRIQSDADGAGSGTNAVHHFKGPGVDTTPQPGAC